MGLFKPKQDKEKREAAAVVTITRATLTRSILATAGILLVLSAAVTAYVTTAWFSMNREVDNSGVHMNIEASPNLIISDLTNSAADKTAFQALTVATADYRIDFQDPTDPETLVTPTTHKAGSSTGLKYLTNPSAVSRSSGLSAGAAALTLADAVNTGTSGDPIYYIEHTVRIASTYKILPTDTLRATFSAYTTTPGDNPSLLDYQYATSVDFYVLAVSANDYTTAMPAVGNYAGTLNLANKDSVKWNADSTTAGAANDKTVVNLYSGDVPWNAATGDDDCCIVVTMRFYFDGALLKTQDLDGQEPDNNLTYVRSAGLSTAGMPNLYVRFEAYRAAGDT